MEEEENKKKGAKKKNVWCFRIDGRATPFYKVAARWKKNLPKDLKKISEISKSTRLSIA